MKVAQIAAPPMLRSSGSRLPISASVKPKKANITIATEISFGSLPVATSPAISAPDTT
jgi:hypothetical protein